jgi:hypothetical protein
MFLCLNQHRLPSADRLQLPFALSRPSALSAPRDFVYLPHLLLVFVRIRAP